MDRGHEWRGGGNGGGGRKGYDYGEESSSRRTSGYLSSITYLTGDQAGSHGTDEGNARNSRSWNGFFLFFISRNERKIRNRIREIFTSMFDERCLN